MAVHCTSARGSSERRIVPQHEAAQDSTRHFAAARASGTAREDAHTTHRAHHSAWHFMWLAYEKMWRPHRLMAPHVAATDDLAAGHSQAWQLMGKLETAHRSPRQLKAAQGNVHCSPAWVSSRGGTRHFESAYAYGTACGEAFHLMAHRLMAHHSA